MQVKLLPNAATTAALEGTLAACNEAANLVSALAHTHRDARGKTPGNYDLRKLCYRQVKELAPGSQAAQHVIKKVADAYTVLRANLKTGRYGRKGSQRYERIAGTQIIFRPDAAQPFDARNLSWNLDARTISILTTAGRIQNIPFTCSARQLATLTQGQIKESDLLARDGRWFVHAVVDLPDAPLYDTDDFIGVDLGIANIATTDDGKPRSGRYVAHQRRRNASIRARLQAKPTKSAKRLLKKRSRKESRFMRDRNHIIAKRIVTEAKRTGCGIALEELTGIRERVRLRRPQRVKVHSWAFRQLADFIVYKANRAGVPVVFVDPAYTSQTCSACRQVDKRNRPNQATFVCTSCGFAEHADVNGAKNIAHRGVLCWAEVMQPHAA